MASIGSLTGSSSSTSSIYGNRTTNIISGLASGLDTEAMIEGMVQGYQQKITALQQDRTVLQWKQEAYQSISDKLVEFARKYTSYTSGTNLFSNSFFNNAVITTTGGAFADRISASGKTSSTITMDAVAQLAKAATASVNNQLGNLGNGTVSGGSLGLSGQTQVSTIDGSISLTYGSQEITLDFGELELLQKDGSTTIDPDKLVSAINEKLADQTITLSGGTRMAASEAIDVRYEMGKVVLTDKLGAGNQVYLSGADGDFADLIVGLDDAVDAKSNVFGLEENLDVVETVNTADYLADKSITVSLDGKSAKISLDGLKITENMSSEDVAKALAERLNTELEDAFGKDKITVSTVTQNGATSLSFQTARGSTMTVTSEINELMGFGGSGLSSYLNTGRTLGDLLGADMGGLEAVMGAGGQTETEPGVWRDSAGNRVDEQGYLLDSDGQRLYELKINGETVGTYSADATMETVINGINTNSDVNVSYSQLTNQFVFTAKETGAAGKIQIDGGLGEALFGRVDQQNGQDAVFLATVNGTQMAMTRSSNSFDIDGMSITLKGTFNAVDRPDGSGPITSGDLQTTGIDALFDTDGEAVTFTSTTDTDTIVDAVKQMVEDYNEILTEVKKAYSDTPLTQSNGSRYEPLTDEDRADMSESAIKEYEDKAKTGLLFMDSDISGLYSALRSAITPGGSDGSFLRSIGISTSYSDGLTTLTLDESALREALEANPDQVRDAFTKSQEYGASTNGLMASIQRVTDRYAATTGAVKGILIEKAGSQYAPTSALSNTMLTEMGEIDDQIERWQEKMSDRVDYYTNKFTQLEILIQQMNSQSSSLAGLMGGY